MMTSPIQTLALRPLAACLAAICATAGSAAGAPGSIDSAPTAPTAIVLNCDDSGPGSLRDTVNAAVSGDIIDLSQLNCSQISLTTGEIAMGQNDLTLQGPGRDRLRIDGGSTAGVLYHVNFGTLKVRDLTIAHGSKYQPDGTSGGGCVHSNGSVSLYNTEVRTCSVTASGPYSALGGAVFAQNNVYLSHSTVSGGFTGALGTGRADGGGVYGGLSVRSLYSIVSDNTALAPSRGGGIFTKGYLGVFESAIYSNTSQDMGGIAAMYPGSTFSAVFNSTISGNEADWIGGMYSRSKLYLYNSTIAKNHTYFANGGHVIGTGLHMGPSLLTTQSSIVADNSSYLPGGYDVGGENGVNWTGLHSIIASTSLPPPPDTIWGPSLLGPLADNGGITPTHALMTGSFAVDFGDMPPIGSFTNDQRGIGFSRLSGGEVDVGAFESDPDRIFISGFSFGRLPPPDAQPKPIADMQHRSPGGPKLGPG
ncbi:MAG: choice-of-anchor Q domain-containing protein [Rhodanobacteraceae bacterium]